MLRIISEIICSIRSRARSHFFVMVLYWLEKWLSTVLCISPSFKFACCFIWSRFLSTSSAEFPQFVTVAVLIFPVWSDTERSVSDIAFSVSVLIPDMALPIAAEAAPIPVSTDFLVLSIEVFVLDSVSRTASGNLSANILATDSVLIPSCSAVSIIALYASCAVPPASVVLSSALFRDPCASTPRWSWFVMFPIATFISL